MDSTPLTIFKDYLILKVGVPAILEPQPVKLQEPHLRLNPTGFDFRSEGLPDVGDTQLWTAQLDLLLTLEAYGDGPDVFLNKVLEASFRTRLLFAKLFSIPLMPGVTKNGAANSAPAGGLHMTVKAELKPGGQFFSNEKTEEGEKPFLFSESYNVSLFFPYSET